MQDGSEAAPSRLTLTERWRSYWQGPGVKSFGALAGWAGDLLGVKSYLNSAGEEERRWRSERSQRIAVANGTALVTCLLAISSRPSLFDELKAPATWFVIGLINSIFGFTFETDERGIYRTFDKFGDEVRRIDETIAAGVSQDIQSSLEKRRTSLMGLLADPGMMSTTSSIKTYYQVSGICFILGLVTATYSFAGLSVDYKSTTQADFAPPHHAVAPKTAVSIPVSTPNHFHPSAPPP
jgi:hypothetical protein